MLFMPRYFTVLWLIFSAAVCSCWAFTAAVAADPPAGPRQHFILGADVTFLLEDEAAGAEYYDGGVKKKFFQLLKDTGFNYVRVPVVVEPTASFSRGIFNT